MSIVIITSEKLISLNKIQRSWPSLISKINILNKLPFDILELLILMAIFSCYLLILLETPGSLVLALLFKTLCIVFFSIIWGYSTWLRYVLILLFWGRIIILFIYCVCLEPNPRVTGYVRNRDIRFLLILLIVFYYVGLETNRRFASRLRWEDLSLGLDLISRERIGLFIYRVCNLLLVLLVVCEMSLIKKGPLLLKVKKI